VVRIFDIYDLARGGNVSRDRLVIDLYRRFPKWNSDGVVLRELEAQAVML